MDARSCNGCLECAAVCPFAAIDRSPLRESGRGLECPGCGRGYPQEDGVHILLTDPMREALGL